MSSNDSMASSRLSQFGLYRTIDARTEEFLKLSRRRQLRQGCVCAAVSSAVTVTIVVSVVILYGYGVTSGGGPSWLRHGNESEPGLEDRLRRLHIDHAALKLLPIFFDKLLDRDTSSPKYDTQSSSEFNFEKDIFTGTNVLAKIPNSRLFAIQYKTYPIVYIHSPKNTDNYSKLRKTREYERIMNYVDKMINEKVNFASSRLVRNKPSIQSPILDENIIRRQLQKEATAVSKKLSITHKKSKNYTTTQPITNTRRHDTYSHNTQPSVKLNLIESNDEIINNECKCTINLGILLDRLIKCFQKLCQMIMEQPCCKSMERKDENHCMKHSDEIITKPTSTTIKPQHTTTYRPHKKYITSTRSPKVPLKLPVSSQNNQLAFNHSNIITNELFKNLPSLYSVVENDHPKQVISDLNIINKPFRRNFTLSKLLQKYENEKYKTISVSTRRPSTTSSTTSTSTSTTTTTQYTPVTGTYEDLFQDILFSQGNVFEVAKKSTEPKTYHQKPFQRDYTILPSPPKHYDISTEKQKSLKSNQNTIQHEIDNVRPKNISNYYNPNNIKLPYIPKHRPVTPEEIVLEMFRRKLELKEKKSSETKSKKQNKRLEESHKKMKDLLSGKQMRPQGKKLHITTSYKFNENKNNNLRNLKAFDIPTTKILPQMYSYDPQTTTTTTTVRSATSISTSRVSTQIQKYTPDQSSPETTTPAEEQQMKPVTIVPKINNSLKTEDLRKNFDTPPYEILPKYITEILPTSTNKNIVEVITTTELNKIKTEIENNLSKSALNVMDGAADYQTLYKSLLPIGKKSYLEISRGDWKLSEPRYNIENLSNEFDGLNK